MSKLNFEYAKCATVFPEFVTSGLTFENWLQKVVAEGKFEELFIDASANVDELPITEFNKQFNMFVHKCIGSEVIAFKDAVEFMENFYDSFYDLFVEYNPDWYMHLTFNRFEFNVQTLKMLNNVKHRGANFNFQNCIIYGSKYVYDFTPEVFTCVYFVKCVFRDRIELHTESTEIFSVNITECMGTIAVVVRD